MSDLKASYFRIASASDDTLLKRLLRENSMPSWVSITTQREPSYFKGASLMGKSYTLIAEKAKELIGMYSCTFLPVHLEGKSEQIGYIGGLRVSSGYRHKIGYIKEGFNVLKQQVPNEATVPFYFTSLASENRQARRLLEANLKGMPHYTPIGEMHTLIFSVKRGRASTQLMQATPKDIPDITAFYNQQVSSYQLSPHLSETWLEALDGSIGLTIDDFWLLRERDGTLQCCLALWDQRAFKQSVIVGYKAPLGILRPLYNLYAGLTGQVPLPKAGDALEHIYIAFFVATQEEIALQALQEASKIAEGRGASSCVLGLSSRHPFLSRLTRALKPSLYRTQIETVTLEGAYPVKCSFEKDIVQPEVALL